VFCFLFNFYLLQGTELTRNWDDWVNSPVHKFSVIGIFVIAGFFIFLNVSKTVRNSKAFQRGEVDIKISKHDEFFNYAQDNYKLNKAEIGFLQDMLERERGEPLETLKNPALLDAAFKAEYKTLIREFEGSPEAAKELDMLFSVKKVMDYFDRNKALSIKGAKADMRLSPRKELGGRCICTVVEEKTEKSRKGKIKKFVLTDRSFGGEFINISSGGCAIQPEKSCKAGTKIKVEWTLNRVKLAALADVIRAGKEKGRVVLHAKFLKIPKRFRYIINAYICGYDAA